MDRLLTEKEASRITGLSVAWFQRKRWAGGGPPYVKLGRAVRYRESELWSWIESHSGHSSTSSYPKKREAIRPSRSAPHREDEQE